MIYDLSISSEAKKANARFNKLLDDENKISLTKRLKKRTLKQNAYLHSLIQLYAIEYGDTLHFCKQDLKLRCPFMNFKKDGFTYIISSSGLDTKNLSEWIEWIRNYAGRNGIYLPNADEFGRDWDKYEKEIERFKPFL